MPFSPTEAKVVSSRAAAAWRAAHTGRVVFTNGVFELLHRGHLEFLEAARAAGDALVVGVNSDASARALAKGADRPWVAAADRARLLAGLTAVDRVVLFEELTPLALIDLIRPDVLVKGGDYRRETVIGADLVEARGGRVVLIPLVANYSTTSLVERIRVSR